MRYFPPLLVLQKMFDTWTVCRCHKLSIWLQVQKLQSIIASRATQYSHDAKRKEREAAKLKERLSQLLVDRKDKKLGNSTLLQYRLMNSSKTMNDLLTYYCSKKLSMYWIAWDEQMEKGATGKPQKQQPGTLKASLTMSVANAIIKLITRESLVNCSVQPRRRNVQVLAKRLWSKSKVLDAGECWAEESPPTNEEGHDSHTESSPV